jgi:hypothetical protein
MLIPKKPLMGLGNLRVTESHYSAKGGGIYNKHYHFKFLLFWRLVSREVKPPILSLYKASILHESFDGFIVRDKIP